MTPLMTISGIVNYFNAISVLDIFYRFWRNVFVFCMNVPTKVMETYKLPQPDYIMGSIDVFYQKMYEYRLNAIFLGGFLWLLFGTFAQKKIYLNRSTNSRNRNSWRSTKKYQLNITAKVRKYLSRWPSTKYVCWVIVHDAVKNNKTCSKFCSIYYVKILNKRRRAIAFFL